MIRTLFCSAAFALVATVALADDTARKTDEELGRNVTLVYDQPLPNVPGKSMRGVLVKYEPGGDSPAHLHPKSAFIYATVLEGAIRSKVNDGPEITYGVGESWSEFPGDRHAVSANASATEPARLLAVFVVDTSETELVIPYD
jgi:quercetin dioxygenase-like cupin family protein